jgi:hypothetical protein
MVRWFSSAGQNSGIVIFEGAASVAPFVFVNELRQRSSAQSAMTVICRFNAAESIAKPRNVAQNSASSDWNSAVFTRTKLCLTSEISGRTHI